LKAAAEHGEKLLNVENQMIRQGWKMNEVVNARADAYERVARAAPTSSASGIMAREKEAFGIFGNAEIAKQFAPFLAQADALIGNATGKPSEGSGYKLLRTGELKGIGPNAEKAMELIKQEAGWINAFGGKIDAEGFLTFARRAKQSWTAQDVTSMSNPMTMAAIATAIADIGGPTAGQSMQSLYQTQQGTMVFSQQQAALWSQAGLLDPTKTHKTGFGGGKMQLDPGAVKGSLEYANDLPGWIRNVVMPAVVAATKGDPALEFNMMAKMFPNRNAAFMAQFFGLPDYVAQQQKDLGVKQGAQPFDQAYQTYLNIPAGAKLAYTQQFDSMMEAIGRPIMLAAIPITQQITKIFTDLCALSNAHSDVVVAIAKGIAALSAALLTGGAAGIVAWIAGLAGAAVGWPVAAAAGVAAALGALIALNWDTVAGGLKTFDDAIVNFQKLAFDKIAAGIKAIGDAISSIWEKIKSILPNVGGWKDVKGDFSRDFGGGGGSSAGALSAGERGQYAGIIKKVAAQEGVDPNALLKIYGTEGASAWYGDGGKSFGPFQLYTGGGLGNQYTGDRSRSAAGVEAQARYVARYGKQHGGWSSDIWHGLRGHGGTIPYRSGDAGADGGGVHVHNIIQMDGKKVAENVMHHVTRGARHPTSVGSAPDGHGSFQSPATESFG
jgi:hypothetical protein